MPSLDDSCGFETLARKRTGGLGGSGLPIWTNYPNFESKCGWAYNVLQRIWLRVELNWIYIKVFSGFRGFHPYPWLERDTNDCQVHFQWGTNTFCLTNMVAPCCPMLTHSTWCSHMESFSLSWPSSPHNVCVHCHCHCRRRRRHHHHHHSVTFCVFVVLMLILVL